MAGEEIEWLDEPALPASSQGTLARRPRRPVVLVVGAVAAVAVVTGALLAGRGDPEPSPTPSAVATVASSSLYGGWTSVPEFHDASPGLLRAVAERFRGPHQITVNGPKARVSIASTPRRVLTERDFTAAEQLIADERVVS